MDLEDVLLRRSQELYFGEVGEVHRGNRKHLTFNIVLSKMRKGQVLKNIKEEETWISREREKYSVTKKNEENFTKYVFREENLIEDKNHRAQRDLVRDNALSEFPEETYRVRRNTRMERILRRG